MEPHGRFARNTKARDLGKSPSAIGSVEPSPGSKLRFTRRRLHVPTLRVMPKSRDTKIAQKVTKEQPARNGPLALRQKTQAVPQSLGAKSISCPFVRLSCPAALRKPRGCCVFVVRAKRREAPHPPRPPPAQSPHRKNPSHARARLARARPRSESITSITIPIPHQIAHARARVLVVVHDLSPGYARVSGDADVVSAKGPRCRACGA